MYINESKTFGQPHKTTRDLQTICRGLKPGLHYVTAVWCARLAGRLLPTHPRCTRARSLCTGALPAWVWVQGPLHHFLRYRCAGAVSVCPCTCGVCLSVTALVKLGHRLPVIRRSSTERTAFVETGGVPWKWTVTGELCA